MLFAGGRPSKSRCTCFEAVGETLEASPESLPFFRV
jgi:hypothetical protein